MANTNIQGFNKTEEEMQDIIKSSLKLMTSGVPIYQLKNIKKEDLEATYAMGYNFYRNGKYKDAANIFGFCAFFNHLNSDYVMALGGAQQMLGQYDMALNSYYCATLLNNKNPKAHFEMGKCLLKLKNIELAEQEFNKALELVVNDESEGKLRQQIESLLESIRKN